MSVASLAMDELGAASEALLGRADVVAQVLAAMRRGDDLLDAALGMVHRGAREDPRLAEELVAWVALELLERGDVRAARALRCYPEVAEERALQEHLFGSDAGRLLQGPFPGRAALVEQAAHLLERRARRRASGGGGAMAVPGGAGRVLQAVLFDETPRLAVALVFLSDPDRSTLRWILLGEEDRELAVRLGVSRHQAGLTMSRVLRLARRRVRHRPWE